MGEVYRARQTNPERELALKLVRPDVLFMDGARDRFSAEVAAIARLQHPGIVQVYAAGETSGIPWFTMEHLQGATIKQILDALGDAEPSSLTGADFARLVGAPTQDGARPSLFDGSWQTVCLRVARQLASALHHAHERGVLHRDVKPSNAMITHDGRVVLLDFGVARSGSSELTRTGYMVGSLRYASPEQRKSHSDDLDVRTDVYSLGLVLYELLTLRHPFIGADDVDVPTVARLADSPRRINRAVDRQVSLVCVKALAPALDGRYDTAAAFAEDLGRALDRRPVLATRPSVGTRIGLLARRRPGAFASAVLGCLLCVVCVIAVIVIDADRDRIREAEQKAWSVAHRNMQLRDVVNTWFQGLDPRNMPGPSIEKATLAKYLEDSARSAVADARDRAYIELLLAQFLNQLSLKERAWAANDRALELLEPHDIAPPGLLGTAYRTKSDQMLSTGNHEEAERLARAALDAYARYEGPDELDWRNRGYTRLMLAKALINLGRHEEADVVLSEACRHTTAKGADAIMLLAEVEGVKAYACSLRRQDEDAIRHQRRAIELHSQARVSPVGIALKRLELSDRLREAGRPEESAKELDAADAVLMESLGEVPLLFRVRMERAQLGAAMGGDPADAARVCLGLAEALDAKHPSEHNQLAVCELVAGELFLAAGNGPKALEMGQRVLARIEKHLPDNFNYKAGAIKLIGDAHVRAGDHEAALEKYMEGLDLLTDELEEEDYRLVDTNMLVGEWHCVVGRPDEGTPYLQRGLRLGRRIFGAENPAFARCLINAARAHSTAGRADSALAYLQSAIPILEKAASWDLVATLYAWRGETMVGQQRLRDAERELQTALDLFESGKSEKGSGKHCAVLWLLGTVKAQLGTRKPSEPDLRLRALEMARRHLGDDHPKTREYAAALKR